MTRRRLLPLIIAAGLVAGLAQIRPLRAQTTATAPAVSGEVMQYNGIILPDPWPPVLRDVPKDPRTPHYLVKPPAVIPIDVGRQLFVDDFLTERTTLARSCHRAEYYAGNPVVYPGMPFSDGVWFDPADGLFKMWYFQEDTRYATSRDGIVWNGAALDVVPGTNIVLQGLRDSATVWLDLEEKDPARRYKLFRSHLHNDERWALSMHFSPDGIHWSDILRRSGVIGDRSTIFWNPFRKTWVYSLRHGWSGDRRRRYWEATDLVEGAMWDGRGRQAPFWTGADSADPPREDYKIPTQLYNLDAVAYESVMLGLFTIWHGQPPPRPKPNDVCLGFSRDGWSWSRPDREPFCPVSEDEQAWNWGNVQSAGGGCLVVGDTLYFYVSGRGHHGQSTGLAMLRRDGFVSMDAGADGGELVTRPVTFGGKHLFINADCPAGELRAEVLDEAGQPIAPFTAGACEPVRADSTLQMVRWTSGADLSALAGRPVRFRFTMTSGRLYAFWVSPAESGASHGYVAAGGPGFTGPTDTVGAAGYREATGVVEKGAKARGPVRKVPERFPPVRMNAQPAGRIEPVTQVTMTVMTDEAAECRYSDKPGTPFADMSHAFKAGPDGTTHTAELTGLSGGQTVTRYVRARDVHGNVNFDDYPIRFTVRPRPQVPVRLELTAVQAERTAPMELVEDAGAAAGQCLMTATKMEGQAVFTVDLPDEDLYIVWARISAPNSSADSFRVAFDAGKLDIFDTEVGPWHWIAIQGREGQYSKERDGRIVLLSARRHTLTFASREAQTRLDRIIITNNLSFKPQE